MILLKASGTSTFSATQTVPITGVTAGNTLIVCVASSKAGSALTPPKLDGAKLQFTPVGIYGTSPDTTFRVGIGYKLNATAGNHALSFTSNGASLRLCWWVFEVAQIYGFDVNAVEPLYAVHSTTLNLPVVTAQPGIAFYTAISGSSIISTVSGSWAKAPSQATNIVTGYLTHNGGKITPGFAQSAASTYIAVLASFTRVLKNTMVLHDAFSLADDDEEEYTGIVYTHEQILMHDHIDLVLHDASGSIVLAVADEL